LRQKTAIDSSAVVFILTKVSVQAMVAKEMNMRVKWNVSLASAKVSYQPGEVVDLPDDNQTRAWLEHGHVERVSSKVPLTNRDIELADLSAEEALAHRCSSCDRARARIVFKNRAYCARCARAAMEG
jgi:hypothetical protein